MAADTLGIVRYAILRALTRVPRISTTDIAKDIGSRVLGKIDRAYIATSLNYMEHEKVVIRHEGKYHAPTWEITDLGKAHLAYTEAFLTAVQGGDPLGQEHAKGPPRRYG